MSSTAFKQPQSSMSSTRTQTFLLLGLHHLFNLDTKSCVSVQVKWSLYQNVWSGEVYAAVHGKVLNSFNNKTLISSALLKYNIIIMQRQKHSNKQTNITTLGSCLTGQCTTGPGRSLKSVTFTATAATLEIAMNKLLKVKQIPSLYDTTKRNVQLLSLTEK